MRGKAQAPSLAVLTPAEARQNFEDHGIVVTQWAKEHGFSRHTVIDLLHGRLKGRYGEAHRAAIALKLKPDPKTKKAA